MPDFHSDATLDCACGLPQGPVAYAPEGRVRYECANRHARVVAMPDDPRLRRLVRNWIDRRSGQLDEQHRRWRTDE